MAADTAHVELGKGESASLENLLRACAETEVGWGLPENDIAFAVAFWSMAECGFLPLAQEDARKPAKEKSQTTLPKGWKHETRRVYEAEFFLPPFRECPVKLVALPADDILCINVLAPAVSPRNVSLRSLAVHSPGYVPRTDPDQVPCKFSGLEDFRLLVRDAVIWPIRCSILTDRGVMNGSLCGLSDEMKLKIIRHLTVREVLLLGETCHELHRICNDQGLWKTIFHEHFPKACSCSEDPHACLEVADWKENFKGVYGRKESSQESIRSATSASYHTAPEGGHGSQIDFDID